jgi:hypothetical protein
MKLLDLITIGTSVAVIAAAATARIELGAAPWYLVFGSIAATFALAIRYVKL